MPSKRPLVPATFRRNLLAWFRRFRRDFPWRRTSDPYAILVSEIMLQQTQTARIAERLPRWMQRFPTFHALARATPAAVLKEWSGLGYNRRALNLHRLAQEVVRTHGGALPRDVATLRTLPGIGAYTANAVRAFAFNLPSAAVDVNVLRVLQRTLHPHGAFRVDDAERLLFDQLVTRSNSRALHSALMDFGATICTAIPKCASCPMQRSCPSAFQIVALPRSRQATRETPPRVYRGRIVRHLTTHARASARELLAAIAPNEPARTAAWVHALLAGLEKDGLVARSGRSYRLP